jgi:hypothetical protein
MVAAPTRPRLEGSQVDIGRTTLIMIAATAAFTVAAARLGRRRTRRDTGADRVGGHICWQGAGRQVEAKEEELTEMAERLGRLETMMAQLMEMGDEVVATSRVQMRAVVGAYEAAAHNPGGRQGHAPRLRQVTAHEP